MVRGALILTTLFICVSGTVQGRQPDCVMWTEPEQIACVFSQSFVQGSDTDMGLAGGAAHDPLLGVGIPGVNGFDLYAGAARMITIIDPGTLLPTSNLVIIIVNPNGEHSFA
jgi:hypothetical protein